MVLYPKILTSDHLALGTFTSKEQWKPSWFKFQIEIWIQTFTSLPMVENRRKKKRPQNKRSMAALSVSFDRIVSSLEMKKWLMVWKDHTLPGPRESWEGKRNERKRGRESKTSLSPLLSDPCSSPGDSCLWLERELLREQASRGVCTCFRKLTGSFRKPPELLTS